jgi:hypothetical protein
MVTETQQTSGMIFVGEGAEGGIISNVPRGYSPVLVAKIEGQKYCILLVGSDYLGQIMSSKKELNLIKCKIVMALGRNGEFTFYPIENGYRQEYSWSVGCCNNTACFACFGTSETEKEYLFFPGNHTNQTIEIFHSVL